MELNQLECALEAVLFASGESVEEAKLCAILGIERAAMRQLAENLSDYYDFYRRGIKLLRLDDKYQLCSRAEYASYVRNALETRRAQSLSSSALEVLAITAYKQPVTKAYVEQVRGVDSSYTVNSLAEKGLIEDCGRLDVPGRPILYRTTEAFLRIFNISDLSQLPVLPGVEEGEQLSIFVIPEAKALLDGQSAPKEGEEATDSQGVAP